MARQAVVGVELALGPVLEVDVPCGGVVRCPGRGGAVVLREVLPDARNLLLPLVASRIARLVEEASFPIVQ